MSEEEKQAIETVKQYKKCFVFETVHEETGERINDYSNAIDIVLNLINKQRKKIKKLNSKINTDNIINKERAELIEQQRKELEERNTRLQEEINEICRLKTELYGKSISKNKIKDKIEEIENVETDKISKEEYNRIEFTVEILLELLEE